MQTPNRPTGNLFERLTTFLPLLWLSLAFLAGILLARQVHISTLIWLCLAAAGLLLALLIRLLLVPRELRLFSLQPSVAFLASLALAVFFLGAARYQVTVPRVDAHHIAWYSDRDYEVLVTGTVADPPDERDTYTNLRVDVSAVNTGDQTLGVHGLILARLAPGGNWQYGDVVRLRGHLKTPPSNEEFSYQDYLARQGILSYMPDAEATRLPFTAGNPVLRLVYTFKDFAVQRIYQIFPDPEASLLAGILLGNDNGMPADLQQAYKNTGTAHIIAISGFNIAIIAGLFVALFSRLLGRRRGAVAAVAGIVLYTVLVGASASVVRAAIMGGLGIFARQVGRRQHGLVALSSTAAVMALVNPYVPWDVGFQLSFGATLGLILYAQSFQDGFEGLLARRLPAETARKIAAPVSEFFLFTLAAQLTTLPIMAYQFQRISLIAVLANPFVLPVQPAVMILAGLALLLGLVYLPLGQLVGWIAWPFAAYTDRAVEFFNRFPNGVIVLGDFSFLFVVLFYAILFLLTFPGPRLKRTLRPILTPTVILAALGIATYLVWAAAFDAPDGRLHLTFLDVGSADAVLIQTPQGRTILVDGGESPSLLTPAIGRRLSPFARSLDWLVVASTQEGEVAALPRLLERYPVSNVLWSGTVDASYSAETLNALLTAGGLPITQAFPGMKLDLGDGATLNVLATNPRGAVLLVEWKSFRTFLPVGVNFDSINGLDNGKAVGPVTALLLADSGYGPSNPLEWLANLHPQLAILSVAAGDPNGMPDTSVVAALKDVTLLRTDRNGWIEITTDGTQMWVDSQQK
ncbi:MAG TPA: ComEC/Rec2 family competence protein [Anaerolineales bacterium]|nr:ComEC/Rec2 family competence protein [Anaerolineales bacterium]